MYAGGWLRMDFLFGLNSCTAEASGLALVNQVSAACPDSLCIRCQLKLGGVTRLNNHCRDGFHIPFKWSTVTRDCNTYDLFSWNQLTSVVMKKPGIAFTFGEGTFVLQFLVEFST